MLGTCIECRMGIFTSKGMQVGLTCDCFLSSTPHLIDFEFLTSTNSHGDRLDKVGDYRSIWLAGLLLVFTYII